MPDENEQTANPDSDKIASKGKAHPADKDVGTTVSKPEVAQANPTAEGVGTTVPKPKIAGGTTVRQPKIAAGTGPGDKDVGTIGIVFLSFFLIAAILLCFLWPDSPLAGSVTLRSGTSWESSGNPDSALFTYIFIWQLDTEFFSHFRSGKRSNTDSFSNTFFRQFGTDFFSRTSSGHYSNKGSYCRTCFCGDIRMAI